MKAVRDTRASLDQRIRKMSQGLQRLGFELEEVRWCNPVPRVWWVELRDRNCSLFVSGGRGASREAAMASALGEFYERLACNQFFADLAFGRELSSADFVHYPNERWFPLSSKGLPEGLMDEATRDHYDLHGQLRSRMLVDTNSGNVARGICAIPFTRQRTGEQVWLPVNILSNLYTNNGMAAGGSVWEGRTQALSEIFERHIKNTILTAGISLPAIPESVLGRHPAFCESIEALRAAGLVVVVQDASLGGKFPLVNITLINPADGGCCAAFGAHPKFEKALERTLTGMMQGRDIDRLSGFAQPCFDLKQVAEQANLEAHFIDSSGVVCWDLLSREPDYAFTEWNVEGDAQAEFEHLCYLIHRVDMDIYIADHEHLGLYCCQVVVPGMADLYPVDRLVHGNNNRAVAMRPALMGLPDLSVESATELQRQLDEARVADELGVAALAGFCPDPGTAWSRLRVGELRCLLALRTGDLQLALEWSDWVLQSGNGSAVGARLYRCLNQLLQFRLDPERQTAHFEYLLQQIHGEPLLRRVRSMLAGGEVFLDLSKIDEDLQGLRLHRSVLDIYRRLQREKTLHPPAPAGAD
ncbi:30S ribosomal protein S12 methylthiotransferase accessory factor YcaO [Marinobacterium aestuariivivens]|uniref:30S ribosomal protein S12 methylthiotransferase accessory factor YcaO n=1 Tax=Marinobacterium aestuariivivens TaxID=1698799 RepID=A0ABW2A4Z7_9GAMM